MSNSFEIKSKIYANAKDVFKAWLDSDLHSKMTGGSASIENFEGGKFSAWDGYITGETKQIIEFDTIIQSWRTSEFYDSDPDSEITIQFLNKGDTCILVLTHINIPENQPDYEQGWQDHYFTPMRKFFPKK